ncbi:MAG: hypothetical protein HOH43_05105 [Candidatus Latescibacteria bacterium]|nr:hypothetical protein [Candidatus Latescibacterota bacterium]
MTRKSRPYPKRKVVLGGMVLFAGAAIVLAAGAEGAARTYSWWKQSGAITPIRTEPDSTLGWRLKSNFKSRAYLRGVFDALEETNSAGIRSDRDYGPKANNTVRVLVIGDSFIYGPGVDIQNTFCRQLETQLNEGGRADRFEVINAGVPAFDTWQSLKWLSRLGPRLKPDIIVLGFYIGNDISQNGLRMASNQLAIAEKEQAFYQSNKASAGREFTFKSYLAQNSEAYRFLRERYHRLLTMFRLREMPAEGDVWWLDQYRKDLAPRDAVGYNATDSLLTSLGTWTRENHAELVHLLIPELGQVVPDFWQRQVGDLISFDPAKYDLQMPNRWLVAFGRKNSIATLDLLPIFKADSQPMTLYFASDSHWSARGQASAAAEASRFLHDQGLIPARSVDDP